jgi:hypothetical protein
LKAFAVSLAVLAFALSAVEGQDLAAPATEQTAAVAPTAPKAALPTFIALHPDINAFRAFADGGWDGNWYVGYNTCWIVKLPKPPVGDYVRAFLGARLGRAKTHARRGGASWERDPIPGKIYIGISNAAAFSPAQSFFLADERFGDRFKLSKNDCGAHHQPSSAKKGCNLRVGHVGRVGQLFFATSGVVNFSTRWRGRRERSEE